MNRGLLAVAIASALLVQSVLGAEFTTEKTDRGVVIKLDGELFTEYLTKSGNKPVMYPLVGPGGAKLTRGYPIEEVEGEHKDHIHHRSLWFTHGDVNGTSFWHEGDDAGEIVHREFKKVEGGPQATIVTVNDWIDKSGKKIAEDERTIVLSDEDGQRLIDFTVTVRPVDEPVTFGDTKEGSFGVRVADPIRVDAKKGGKIVTSEGLTDGSAWGKPASWVDYHGPVDGKTRGIAILNHPSSFGYPTHWHVRTYGLFAANPFGLKDFKAGKTGSHTIKPGEAMTLKYRVILHEGDTEQAKIGEAFKRYAEQPSNDKAQASKTTARAQ